MPAEEELGAAHVRPSSQQWPRAVVVCASAAAVLVATIAVVNTDVRPNVLYALGRAGAQVGYPGGLKLRANGQLFAQICFQNVCADASPAFVKQLVANEKGAFLLGEQTGLRQAKLQEILSQEAQAQERQSVPQERLPEERLPREPEAVLTQGQTQGKIAAAQLQNGPDVKQYVPSTLQAILHSQARAMGTKPEKKPVYKSQWVSIFGSNYI